jgi:regulator of RNase E activity RraA
LADGDGVVVVPKMAIPSLLKSARARTEREDRTRKATSEGKLPGDMSGLYAKLDASGIKVSDDPWR